MNKATSKLWGDKLELSVFSGHHGTHLVWAPGEGSSRNHQEMANTIECSNPCLPFRRQKLAYNCSIPESHDVYKSLFWEFTFFFLPELKFIHSKTTRINQ